METTFLSEKVRAWQVQPDMLQQTPIWVLSKVDAMTLKVPGTSCCICLKESFHGKVSVPATKKTSTIRSKTARLVARLKLFVSVTLRKCKHIWTIAEISVSKRHQTTLSCADYLGSYIKNVSSKMNIFLTGQSKGIGSKCQQLLHKMKNKNKTMEVQLCPKV